MEHMDDYELSLEYERDSTNTNYRDVYETDVVDVLLEDDALSFEEAAFMMGYLNNS